MTTFDVPPLPVPGQRENLTSLAGRSRAQLGLVLPALHRLDRDSGRFTTLTLDVRGKVAGMGHLPAGQAIAVLIRFGARVT